MNKLTINISQHIEEKLRYISKQSGLTINKLAKQALEDFAEKQEDYFRISEEMDKINDKDLCFKPKKASNN